MCEKCIAIAARRALRNFVSQEILYWIVRRPTTWLMLISCLGWWRYLLRCELFKGIRNCFWQRCTGKRLLCYLHIYTVCGLLALDDLRVECFALDLRLVWGRWVSKVQLRFVLQEQLRLLLLGVLRLAWVIVWEVHLLIAVASWFYGEILLHAEAGWLLAVTCCHTLGVHHANTIIKRKRLWGGFSGLEMQSIILDWMNREHI